MATGGPPETSANSCKVRNSKHKFVVALDGETFAYKILSGETIFQDVIKLVESCKEVLGLSRSAILLLLNHVKWDKERLLEAYYENEDKLLKDANAALLALDTNLAEDVSFTIFCCEICTDDNLEIANSSALNCGHRFCNECWLTYLDEQIKAQGKSLRIGCPGSKCAGAVDYDFVLNLVEGKEDLFNSYQQLVAKSFVEANKRRKWCPAIGCDKVVDVEHVSWVPITCFCGTSFCFLCASDWHEPLTCELLARWLRKCSDDSETLNWIHGNTKDCPKCFATIEKNGGCDHMTCRQSSCRYEFCWVCKGDWSTHKSNYNCHAFVEKNAADKASEARVNLERYVHHFERYMNHCKGLEFEPKLRASVAKKMDSFQSQHKVSWIDVQYFVKAIETLLKCRKVLKYTYPFAFFLVQSNHGEMFVNNQRDLEIATQRLCEYLEEEHLDDEDSVRYNGWHQEGLKMADPPEIKQKITETTAYCESRRAKLVSHVLAGYDEDLWEYRAV